jgi:putative SOS response-associated peptidase YedK
LKFQIHSIPGIFYRLEDNYPHFAILTRAPGEDIAFIHDRMPLIIPEEAVNDWINSKYDASALLPHALTDCVFEEWTEKEEAEARKPILQLWQIPKPLHKQ